MVLKPDCSSTCRPSNSAISWFLAPSAAVTLNAPPWSSKLKVMAALMAFVETPCTCEGARGSQPSAVRSEAKRSLPLPPHAGPVPNLFCIGAAPAHLREVHLKSLEEVRGAESRLGIGLDVGSFLLLRDRCQYEP